MCFFVFECMDMRTVYKYLSYLYFVPWDVGHFQVILIHRFRPVIGAGSSTRSK